MILKYFCIVFVSLFACLSASEWSQSELQSIPMSYKGRIRPSEAFARLWLYELYGDEEIHFAHRTIHHSDFQNLSSSALDLIWELNFWGHEPWDQTLLFKINATSILENLALPTTSNYFSYRQLYDAIYENKSSNLRYMSMLLPYYFWKNYLSPINRSKRTKQELRSLAPGLWVELQGDKLVVVSAPKDPPWNFLEPGTVVMENIGLKNDPLNSTKHEADVALKLLMAMNQFGKIKQEIPSEERLFKAAEMLQKQGLDPKEIAFQLDTNFPLMQRLNQAGTLLQVLPSAQGGGVWLPLKALKVKMYDPISKNIVPVSNFTLYPDDQFEAIRSLYLALEDAVLKQNRHGVYELGKKLASQLNESYRPLAGTLAIEAAGKVMTYPTAFRLKAEVFYYRFPMTPLILVLYLLAAVTLIGSYFRQRELLSHSGFAFLAIAFVLHTLLLALRCYILKRPPVSNMFETVVYVPWVTVLASILLYMKLRLRLLLVASSIGACVLLLLLQATALHHDLENVQPVLDSQYWLIIHVLLVVGSYGTFALAGLMGHLYLFVTSVKRKESTTMRFLGKCILQAMYIGVAMLIPGTILGGVWAAESWGRFWDWDPKESWAFISCCLYLMWIHAFRMNRIRYFGLAMGAVAGFLAITFTWYGVNYILGTGLHSYGFGSGGELYYYMFLMGEFAFLSYVVYAKCFAKKTIELL